MDTQVQVGSKLANGYKVLAVYATKHEALVLAFSGSEFASWKMNPNKLDSTHEGFYYTEAENAVEAMREFKQRVINSM